MFANVYEMEGNIKRHRGSSMMQRRLGATLMEAEQRFESIKGFQDITKALRRIKGIKTKTLICKETKDKMKSVA